MADTDTIFYDDEVQEDQHTWYWAKQHSVSTSAAEHATWLHDKTYWAVMLLIVLACSHFTAVDYGGTPQPLSSFDKLVSSFSSSSPQRLSLYSTVSNVDLKTGILEVELTVHQLRDNERNRCSSPSSSLQHELVVGSTSHGAAQVVVPLCSAAALGQPVRVALPLIKQAGPHPFDEHTVDIRFSLRQAHASPETATAAATSLISNDAALELDWSAVWAVPGLQVTVERKMSTHAKLLSAVAGADSALLEQLGSSLKLERQAEAVYRVCLVRSSWLRIMHLTAALVQVVAVGWCCMLLLGQCVCAYLLQRFICSTVHGAEN